MRGGRSAARLPQDVLISGDPPEPTGALADLEELTTRHRVAVERGAHADRAGALWGLIAHGAGAASWCADALTSDNEDVVEDAAGVLAWIGVPPAVVPLLIERLRALPDGQARDAVAAALPADARAALFAADDAAAVDAGDVPFGPRHPEIVEVWFVEASYDELTAAYRAWMTRIDRRTRFSEHRGSLNALLDRLNPPVGPDGKTRHVEPGDRPPAWLLIETASGWTAVIAEADAGADSASYLARVLCTRALRTSFSVHVTDEAGDVLEYGDVAFWLFDGNRTDRPLRIVQASRGDSGWTWDLSGEPQPFEDLARYRERRIPRRFDRELLNDYCRAIGIRREDPAYYGPRALLCEHGKYQRR
jgi:hypothetical protein